MGRLYGIIAKNEKIIRIEGSIKKDQIENNYRHLAENYRDLAKILFEERLYSYAIEMLDMAVLYNSKCELYERELQDRLYKVEILTIQNNYFDLANEYASIGHLCKDKLKDNEKAMNYFRYSALSFEREGNYFECHKMAYQAYLNAPSRMRKKEMLNIAIRSSIKQQLHSKVIFYIDALLEITNKELSNHDYLSTCMKGYHAAKKLGNDQKVIEYLKPHIDCHCNGIIEQKDIKEVTRDYLFAYVRCNRKVCKELYSLIDNVYSDLSERSTVYSDLSVICFEIGLIEYGSKIKIMAYDNLTAFFRKEKNYTKYLVFLIWKVTSQYGESMRKWTLVSGILILFFACIYGTAYKVNPELFVVQGDKSFFSPIYFSVVTFTTLGFGDIYPKSCLGQVIVVIEVLIGYMMLGGIVSIFSKKVIR